MAQHSRTPWSSSLARPSTHRGQGGGYRRTPGSTGPLTISRPLLPIYEMKLLGHMTSPTLSSLYSTPVNIITTATWASACFLLSSTYKSIPLPSKPQRNDLLALIDTIWERKGFVCSQCFRICSVGIDKAAFLSSASAVYAWQTTDSPKVRGYMAFIWA